MTKIYEPTGRAREYSPLALNIYHGCTHGCTYCYVPKMFRRWNSCYDHSECVSYLDERVLEKSAKKYMGCGKQILLSFTGDPYPNTKDRATRRALEILLKYGHKVAILTKGGERCLEDIDIFKKFGDNIKVGATLSFFNEQKSKEWEPGAASPSERLWTLQELHRKGIKTWASFEPVIDPNEALMLIDTASEYIEHVKIGKINGNSAIEKSVNWAYFLEESVGLCRMKGLQFYIKDSLKPFESETKITLSEEEKDMDFLNL